MTNSVRLRRWLKAPFDLIVDRLETYNIHDSLSMSEFLNDVWSPSLDKVFISTWRILENRLSELTEEGVQLLADLYRFPFESQFPRPEKFGREVIIRVYILGALCLENHLYTPIPTLVRQRLEREGYWGDFYWARHCLTMLARAKELRNGSLCTIALDQITSERFTEALFGYGPRAKETATEALCSFDFVQCLMAAHDANDLEAAYPSFGAYYPSRVERLVVELLKGSLASELLPQIDRRELPELIWRLNAYANREFRLGGWAGRQWAPETIRLITSQMPEDRSKQILSDPFVS